MSKSQQTQTYQNAQGQQATNNANEGAVNTQLQSILGTAQGNTASELPGIESGYSDIASSGGYNPTDLSTIDTTATNLATTGGFSPTQIGAMQDQAANAAASTYKTAQSQAERTSAATGGYGNNGAIEASLARQGSNAASSATQGVLGTIAGLQQSGEEAGVGELNTTNQNMAGNKLAAVGGEASVYGMNQQQITSTVNQILQNYNQTGQLNNQDLAVLTNLANQPGVFAQITNTLGTLGGAAGGILTGLNGGKSSTPGGCWIAESIYGIDDIRTKVLRMYVNSGLLNKWIVRFYLTFGKAIAKIIRMTKTQSLVRPIFDNLLYN